MEGFDPAINYGPNDAGISAITIVLGISSLIIVSWLLGKISAVLAKFSENNKTMTKWIRFNFKQDASLFGILDGDSVDEYEGDLFENPKPTGRKIPFNEVQLLAPLEPNSIFALWNNFHERAEMEEQKIPDDPLYFMKPITSVIGPEQTIYRPQGLQGWIIFEATVFI